MLIDTTVSGFEEQNLRRKQKLIDEKIEKGYYSAEDIAIVRVTDHLPVDGVMPAISNVPFVAKMNDLAFEAVDSILEEQGLSWEERKDIAREYSPLSTQYRSSVHFCLNGVVSSHAYGNFEGNPFVVIDPFSAHENDENILAVRGEDTYFKGGVSLSKNAVILVDERYAEHLLDSDISERFQVIYYRGDQAKATESVLLNMGIVPEVVGQDYIIDSSTSGFINSFIDTKGYPRDKHCYSESYRSDDMKTYELWQKYAENFYTYIYSNVYENVSEKQQEISYLVNTDRYDSTAIEIFKNTIKLIGLDNYKSLVDSYNSSITTRIERGEYPNNNEILAGGSLEVSVQNKI